MLFARFSRQQKARVILTFPLTEMYATVRSAIVCDCLRLYGNNSLYDRLRLAIRDRLRSSAIIWKPTLNKPKNCSAADALGNIVLVVASR